MTRTPDFDELIGDDVSGEERARLRRVHDLIVAAGPPPELSPGLRRAPAPPGAVVKFLPRRRRATWAVLAAALAAASFGGGYLAGDGGDGRPQAVGAPLDPVRVVRLRGTEAAPNAVAVVRLGKTNEAGNWSMLVTVEGLRHLPEGDYYTLYMLKNGRRVVACGTFNVAGGSDKTTVRLNAAYSLEEFDGFSVTEYRHVGHTERDLLKGTLSA